MPTCYKCHHELPTESFGKDVSKPSGHSSICKACKVTYTKSRTAYYESYKPIRNERKREGRPPKKLKPAGLSETAIRCYKCKEWKEPYREEGTVCADCKYIKKPKKVRVPSLKTARLTKQQQYEQMDTQGKFVYRVKQMLSACRRRAKELGKNFDLTPNDFIYSSVCPVLGIPYSLKWGDSSRNVMSMDRKNNELGYVKGNVHIISLEANMKKSNSTIADLEKIIAYMKSA